MQSRLIDLIGAFARQNPVVYSSYLLFVEGQNGLDPEAPESLYAFALWFLVYGRREFRAPVVIDDLFRTAVTTLDQHGCHPLMHYLAQHKGLDLEAQALRAWYYCEGVAQGGIAGCLGRVELAALGRPVTPNDGRSHLDHLIDQRSKAGATPSHPAFLRILATLARKTVPGVSLPSVTIVGLHKSILGIGEDARCLFECLTEAGIVAELLDVSPAGLERDELADHYEPFEAVTATGSIVIFCLPAFETMRAIGTLNLTRMKGQYWIGYWPWETTALPDNWRHAYDYVDEVWASSRFLLQVYSGETSKPVVHMPLHIKIMQPMIPEDVRSVFDGRFSFLSIFDFNSRIERKNPLGSIEAFRKAFPPSVGDVQLVLKSLHGDHRPKDLDRIVAAAGEDDRIVIIDGAFPKAELCGLITLADVYLSLHRSEGFGRPLAEAMLLKTPVIATGWSGCSDFLTETTGFPVRSVLRPVRPGEYAFVAGDWAEPDIDHAASLMRQIHADPGIARGVLVGAKYSVEHSLGRQAIAGHLLDRLTLLSGGAAKPTPFRLKK